MFNPENILKKAALGLAFILFALLPFNAIITNYLRFGLGVDAPINIWKEIIIILLTLLFAADLMWKRRKLSFNRLDYVLIAFLALGVLSAIFQTKQLMPSIYGFKYDFEFLWLFMILRHSSFFTADNFKFLAKTVLTSGGTVIIFGLLQALVLPKDFMLNFAYSPNFSSWLPGDPLPMYHAVEGGDLIRSMSTLSGPNQLAAYLMILTSLGLGFLLKVKESKKWLWALFVLTALVTTAFTFSRSAYIGTFIIIVTSLFLFIQNKKRLLKVGVSLFIICSIAVGGVFAIKPNLITDLVVRAESTGAHFERTLNGTSYIISHPAGIGIGKAGPASVWLDDDKVGFIPESWYLQIGIELGILGLILFISIILLTMKQLLRSFKEQKNHIHVGLFLALLGISVAALFLHSWEESAVALTLWGLMGLSLNKSVSG